MSAQRLSPSHPAYPLLVQVNTVIGQVTQLAGKSSRDASSMSALLNGVMPQLEYLQSLGAYTDGEIERLKSLISQHSSGRSRSGSSRTSSSAASSSSRDSSPPSPSSSSSHSSQSRHHMPAYTPSREAPPTLGNMNNTRIVRQPDLHRVADARKAARAAGEHVQPVGFQIHHPHSKRGESPSLARDQNGFITPYNPIVQ